MCDLFVWSFDTITSIRWPEVIGAIANVATAIIAFSALKSWRRQDKAKRETEFLDLLIETVHSFIGAMPAPLTHLEMAKIGMDAYVPTGEGVDSGVKGAIAYIQKNGEHDSKRLREALEIVRPFANSLRSLVAKGQVFKFDEYPKCYNAIAELMWEFDKIEAFMAIIGSPMLNWEHPDALEQLRRFMTIDPEEIRTSLRKNNVIVLEFSGNAYKLIYG